jgi:hypothetical protein
VLAPWLERMIALKREQAACRSPGLDAYDALLDDYEPGCRWAALAALFAELRAEIVPLVRACGQSATRPDDHVGKRLLWKDQLGCNVEGLCLGPRLGAARRAVLAVADNNGIGTPNQVIAFVLEEAADEMSLPMVAGSAILVALLAVAGLTLYRLGR